LGEEGFRLRGNFPMWKKLILEEEIVGVKCELESDIWLKIGKKSNIQGEKTHKFIVLRFWVESDVMVSYMSLFITRK